MYFRYETEAIKKFGKSFYRNKNKKEELIFPCPHCNPSVKTDKLYVNVKTGVYHCFRCGFAGKLKAKAKLSDIADTFKQSNRDRQNNENTIHLLPFHKFDLTSEQLDALYQRGLTDDDIEFYNITGGKRIQIPNYVKGNFSDLVCNWEWRKDKISKTNPKYLYTEGVVKSNILFNLHRIPEHANITLCEGIFNAITAGRYGVASYGCALSDVQVSLLVKANPRTITIAYDSDEPGVLGAIKAIEKLKNIYYEGTVYYILLPKGVDINDLGREKYLEYLKNNVITINLQSKLSCNLPRLLFENR